MTMSPQISRTLLGILADFSRAVGLMVLILTLIFSYPQSLFQVLCDCSKGSNKPSLPSCSSTFLVLWQGLDIHFFTFIFTLSSAGTKKSTRWQITTIIIIIITIVSMTTTTTTTTTKCQHLYVYMQFCPCTVEKKSYLFSIFIFVNFS